MDVSGLFTDFKNKKILVVGDVMLDRYMIGNVSRISPEAPVPIIELSKEEDRLGGAANVALNIVALGAKVVLGSLIGNDVHGEKIKSLCKESGIDDSAIFISSSRPTTVKTRIIGNKQQLVRIDSENSEYLTTEEESHFIEQILSILSKGFDALIFEDYNKGLLTEKIIHTLISESKKYNIITSVDPKKKNFFAYQQVTLFKPNFKELKEGLNIQINFPDDKSSLEKAIDMLNQRIFNEYTFITLSEYGVAISNHTLTQYFDAHVRNISDVSGAGDTVIAVATLCLASGCSMDEIAQISNLAGGLVCEKPGVVSINSDELFLEVQELFQPKKC